MAGFVILARIAGIQPVDIGQQQQQIGADHRGDTGGKPVIVAKADFGGGDGVVLIDHRHRPEVQQRGHGGAGVQMPATGLGILRRQQDLRHADIVAGKRLAPGMRQNDLASGRRRLLFLKRQVAPVDAKLAAAKRDRAAGHNDDMLAVAAQHGDVTCHAGDPVGIHPVAGLIHQQR